MSETDFVEALVKAIDAHTGEKCDFDKVADWVSFEWEDFSKEGIAAAMHAIVDDGEYYDE